jgi:PilX N-terminal
MNGGGAMNACKVVNVMSVCQGRPAGREGGFALILALLSLMLLTFLGLTMALSTSTELQIATNYRWSQQALYNAEAGLELAKRSLINADWRSIVPPARAKADMTNKPQWYNSVPGPYGEASRDFEMADCDAIVSPADLLTGKGNEGFGIVLVPDPGSVASFQNSSNAFNQSLNGTFTVWVRRPLTWKQEDDFKNLVEAFVDYEKDDQLVLTAEGTAPYIGAASLTTSGLANRATRYLETTIKKIDMTTCEDLIGQTGVSPTGSGFDQCGGQTFAQVPGATGENTGVK